MKDGQGAARGADLLCSALESEGVETIFALSGNQIMPVFDAALDTGLRLIHTRHEAAAAYAAEAHAQITGGLGVALVTAGAGLANALAPLLTARASQTPLLLLSGDSPRAGDGTGTFQEMDQVGLTQSLTKRSYRLRSADEIPRVLAELAGVAQSGTPGPVHLALPDDILRQTVQDPLPPVARATTPAPDIGVLTAAVRNATRPLILLGPHLSESRAPGLRKALREATGAPVLCLESPRGLRDPALGAWKQAMAQADLILSIGKPVDFTQGFGTAAVAPQASWHVITEDTEDASRAEVNLSDRLETLTIADPGVTARAFASHPARGSTASEWLAQVDALVAKRPERGGNGLTSQSLCDAVQGRIALVREPVLICDGGEFGQWAQSVCHAPTRIVNGVSGAIGGSIGYAIGARAARPNATIYALMGDGTAGFHLSEFETAAREALPFVAVIGNDNRWNAEHLIQARDYGTDRTHGCQLSDARYDEAVCALGGFGAYVERLDDLEPALRAAEASGLPACVNVKIDGLAAPDP
ncbi:thiamine pyrophosphate-binding protein [Cognatishimia sp. F0-27]|uniref:thiamine pyrophosphate-binding protein n=1 Tax=Cognatishimia sp. F0-27 TaxID=2816855 RepID=UPI001D0C907C|nr:thiamine pyrophosphate-binding protein [Cognatishimia sp. F0-27]MCC1492902.1 thiamine pyrophosphate-binding protein [Cognatishimia sp. F0-27]